MAELRARSHRLQQFDPITQEISIFQLTRLTLINFKQLVSNKRRWMDCYWLSSGS